MNTVPHALSMRHEHAVRRAQQAYRQAQAMPAGPMRDQRTWRAMTKLRDLGVPKKDWGAEGQEA